MMIAIVTDSTCDIPADTVEQYQIQIIPNILVIDGKSVEDGVGMSRQEFYEKLPKLNSVPTTASPSVGTFQEVYDRLLSKGVNRILSIHPPSSLSGIYNAANLAAQTFEGLVHVVDSGQVTLGMGFQVLHAAEAIAKGFPFEQILNQIENIRKRCRVIAMLDTLEYVRRSGRVSWARARIGSLLDIKPLIELQNGSVVSLGQTRTRRKGIEWLHTMLHNLGPIEKLAILHTNCEREAHLFFENLKIQLPTPPFVVNVTTIIGAHVGPQGLGFAAVTR